MSFWGNVGSVVVRPSKWLYDTVASVASSINNSVVGRIARRFPRTTSFAIGATAMFGGSLALVGTETSSIVTTVMIAAPVFVGVRSAFAVNNRQLVAGLDTVVWSGFVLGGILLVNEGFTTNLSMLDMSFLLSVSALGGATLNRLLSSKARGLHKRGSHLPRSVSHFIANGVSVTKVAFPIVFMLVVQRNIESLTPFTAEQLFIDMARIIGVSLFAGGILGVVKNKITHRFPMLHYGFSVGGITTVSMATFYAISIDISISQTNAEIVFPKYLLNMMGKLDIFTGSAHAGIGALMVVVGSALLGVGAGSLVKSYQRQQGKRVLATPGPGSHHASIAPFEKATALSMQVGLAIPVRLAQVTQLWMMLSLLPLTTQSARLVGFNLGMNELNNNVDFDQVEPLMNKAVNMGCLAGLLVYIIQDAGESWVLRPFKDAKSFLSTVETVVATNDASAGIDNVITTEFISSSRFDS